MRNDSQECLITQLWLNQLPGRTDLVTEEGEPIEIIYPGRINEEQGADLRDVVIATSRGIIKGDIEVHVKSSSWQTHRHQQHPTYNRVVLHVVLWCDTGATTRLPNGLEVPILALHQYLKSPKQWPNLESAPVGSNLPCRRTLKQLPTSVITESLDHAGKERFLVKAAEFQANFAQTEVSQSLYQGIMGALGYTKNKGPCLELARRLPIQRLEALTQSQISDEDCLAQQQAILLGTAGLLPSQRSNWYPKKKNDDLWLEKLEKLWASSPQIETMSENDWQRFKVRPNNSPLRRLAAMSHLILRYQAKGIFAGIVHRIAEVEISQGHRELTKALFVATDGYWAHHFDFGISLKTKTPTLLGSNRAAEIVVNVLLPFTFAWSHFTAQPELAEKSLALYRRYPRLGTNAVERHMSQQFRLNANLVSSAQRQQGLMHIYKTGCTQGKCHECVFRGQSN